MRPSILATACLAIAALNQSCAFQPQGNTGPAVTEREIGRWLSQEFPDAEPIRFALAWNDLDGDGADEAIVYFVSPYVCGSGGCNTLVLKQDGGAWRMVSDISVSRTPITVLDTRTNGWRDLTVAIAGGGGAAGNALLRYDGRGYPSNPTVAPARTTAVLGTELIGAEPELTELSGDQASGE